MELCPLFPRRIELSLHKVKSSSFEKLVLPSHGTRHSIPSADPRLLYLVGEVRGVLERHLSDGPMHPAQAADGEGQEEHPSGGPDAGAFEQVTKEDRANEAAEDADDATHSADVIGIVVGNVLVDSPAGGEATAARPTQLTYALERTRCTT